MSLAKAGTLYTDASEGEAVLYGPGKTPERLIRAETISGTGPIAGFELRAARSWPKP